MPQQLCCLLCLFLLVSCADRKLQHRWEADLKNTYGTYGAPPRLPGGRVDHQQLVAELTEIHANTYHWLIWQNEKDWDDLKVFLPLAAKHHIKVWVTVVPPSESKPRAKASSEPYQLDYKRWAIELARLSLQEPNLVAWSIDDFAHNLPFFTREYMVACLEGAKAINPRLAFIPCVYYRQATPVFAAAYGDLMDGLLFPYRAESAGGNLKDARLVEPEVAAIRKLFRKNFPVFIDIYASAHSRLGPSSAEYVKEVLDMGKRYADGVLIYCHQDPVRSSEKYTIIKTGFSKR